MNSRLRAAWSVLRESGAEFSKDRVPQLSAAVAYYTIFSLAPLLVISISLAGLIFGERAARGEIEGVIDDLVGPVAADQIETMIEEAGRAEGGTLATILGIGAMLFGASGVFFQLSMAMNQIWSVDPSRTGVKGMVFKRVAAFGLVLSVGFLLLVSLVASAALAVVGRVVEQQVSGGLGPLWRFVDVFASFAVITILFAILFRYLPDTRVEWRSVWAGAALTSLLFAVGKFAIGSYLGTSGVGSTFGAAGSLAVVLIWIYLSALIFFFGAEITEVIARRQRKAAGEKEEARTSESEHLRSAEEQVSPLPPSGGGSAALPFAAGAASGLAVGCAAALVAGVIAMVAAALRLFRR